jgi:esterase
VPHTVVNGVRLYYEERGSGTPILGIHGAGSAALLWEHAAEKLSQLGRAITYDRRGSSRSERPDPYEITSVRQHADDALALLRALDAEPAILIGRSYGGTVALDLALRRPESVLAVALLEAGVTALSPEYDAWFSSLSSRVEHSASRGGVEAVGEMVVREVLGGWDELPETIRSVFTENGAALLAEVRGGETTDDTRLGALAVPALVVTADASPLPIRRGSEALAGALAGARHVRVEGDHAIDPAGPEVLAFVATVLDTAGRT